MALARLQLVVIDIIVVSVNNHVQLTDMINCDCTVFLHIISRRFDLISNVTINQSINHKILTCPFL